MVGLGVIQEHRGIVNRGGTYRKSVMRIGVTRRGNAGGGAVQGLLEHGQTPLGHRGGGESGNTFVYSCVHIVLVPLAKARRPWRVACG